MGLCCAGVRRGLLPEVLGEATSVAGYFLVGVSMYILWVMEEM